MGSEMCIRDSVEAAIGPGAELQRVAAGVVEAVRRVVSGQAMDRDPRAAAFEEHLDHAFAGAYRELAADMAVGCRRMSSIFIMPVIFIAPPPSRSARAINQAGSGENRHLGRPVGRRRAMAGQARSGASARTVKCSGIGVKSARNLQPA